MTIKGEKIFSLFKSAENLPSRDDIKSQWHEFFCYLFLALLYDEGSDPRLPAGSRGELNHSNFTLTQNVYHSEIGRVISKGLFERFYLLFNNPDRSEKERDVLAALNYVFAGRPFVGRRLQGQAISAICEMRGLGMETCAVADYLSVMIGQLGFYTGVGVPRLSVSLFGNIYLRKDERIHLTAPTLIYGQTVTSGDTITALWSLLSAMTDHLARFDYPGDALGDIVSDYAFMSHETSSEFVPLPKITSTLFLQNLLGLNSYNPVSVSALFYKQFLYGTIEAKTVARYPLMNFIMRQLSDTVGDAKADYLFRPDSYLRRLDANNVQSSSKGTPTAPLHLKMALEALDTDPGATDDATDINEPAVDTDPSAEPAPVAEDGDFENSMDLVSFNKSGEGINEDLYRSAVVALNDRIQSDPSFPVTPEIKQALHQWVNGWIYRAAIAATKDQIATLKLTQYLKSVSHIPTK